MRLQEDWRGACSASVDEAVEQDGRFASHLQSRDFHERQRRLDAAAVRGAIRHDGQIVGDSEAMISGQSDENFRKIVVVHEDRLGDRWALEKSARGELRLPQRRAGRARRGIERQSLLLECRAKAIEF